jgi:hypothetical protein
MRSFRMECLGLAGITFLLAAGCQKLNYEKIIQLESGDIKSFLIPGPRAAQQVNATVSSPGTPVDAFVVLEQDRPAVENSLQLQEKPRSTLAQGRGEELTLSATIPAKTAYSVIVSGANKTTEVKIKVMGQPAS